MGLSLKGGGKTTKPMEKEGLSTVMGMCTTEIGKMTRLKV
jgi:hypothetical protein